MKFEIVEISEPFKSQFADSQNGYRKIVLRRYFGVDACIVGGGTFPMVFDISPEEIGKLLPKVGDIIEFEMKLVKEKCPTCHRELP